MSQEFFHQILYLKKFWWFYNKIFSRWKDKKSTRNSIFLVEQSEPENFSAIFTEIETRIIFFCVSFTFQVPFLDISGPILWFSYSFWQLGVGGPEKRTRNVQKSRTRKVKETWKIIYLSLWQLCSHNNVML